MADHRLHDSPVLMRTDEGQHAAFDDIRLDDAERRLLRLVNGYTPLADLVKRLGDKRDWSHVARLLMAEGLLFDVAD
jgi:hypothetical protein